MWSLIFSGWGRVFLSKGLMVSCIIFTQIPSTFSISKSSYPMGETLNHLYQQFGFKRLNCLNLSNRLNTLCNCSKIGIPLDQITYIVVNLSINEDWISYKLLIFVYKGQIIQGAEDEVLKSQALFFLTGLAVFCRRILVPSQVERRLNS